MSEVASTGFLLGLAGVGPAVFADGMWTERLVLLATLVIVYWLAGMMSGFIGSSWRWSLLLVTPGLLIGLVLGEQQPWVLLFLAIIVASTAAAGYTGVVLRYRRRS